MNSREDLYEHLRSDIKVLELPLLSRAFKEIDRADFVAEDYKVEAYEDYALPIGYGQTINQPTIVAFMLELLDVKKNEEVLDIGAGSGWTTALMANMVGAEGSVLGLEIVPELVKLGQENLASYKYHQASIINTEDDDDTIQFDKILVSATAEELPLEIADRLRVGGTMVIPIEESLFKIYKNEDGELEEEEFPGFSFATLI